MSYQSKINKIVYENFIFLFYKVQFCVCFRGWFDHFSCPLENASLSCNIIFSYDNKHRLVIRIV